MASSATITPARRFFSNRDLKIITGLSQPPLIRMVARGELPQPLQLSPGRVAFDADEIETWLAQRREKRAEVAQ